MNRCERSHCVLCIIGRRFSSPAKPGARAECAKERAVKIREHSLTPFTSSGASRYLTPFPLEQPPTTSTTSDEPGTSYSEEVTPKSSGGIDMAQLAHIEMLESENSRLKKEPSKTSFSCRRYSK